MLDRVEHGERSALAFRVRPATSTVADNSGVAVLLPPPPGADEHSVRTLRDAGWQGKVITLQPPRAVYTREEVRGFTWYHAAKGDAIEPSSFGDSLWHVERFVLDLLQGEQTPERVILIGVEEGATIALAAVPYLHDRISAVIAVNGALPMEAWWEPPSPQMRQFPVWVIRSRKDDPRDTNTIRSLTTHGACVEVSEHFDADPLQTLRDELSGWLQKNGLADPGSIHA